MESSDSRTRVVSIKNYPNYAVNRFGEVFNSVTGRKLKQQTRKGQYQVVFLYNEKGRKCLFVHRIVATAFLPNTGGLPQVNHKDENPRNNCVDNLEWSTAKYNSNYGTHNTKIRNHMLTNNPFKGKKHTRESKEKMRKAKVGCESKRKRQVEIDGVVYPSVTDAMVILNISTRRLYKLIEEAS